jgi:uncharacterized protein (TIGR03437 family)
MRSLSIFLFAAAMAAAQSAPLTGTHFPNLSDFPTLSNLGYDFAVITLNPSQSSSWAPALDAAQAAGLKLIVGGYPAPYTESNGVWTITTRGTQLLTYLKSRSDLILAIYVFNEPYSTNPATSAVTPCGYYSASDLRALRTTLQAFWPGVKIYHDLGFPSDWAPGSAYTAETPCVGNKYADQTGIADYAGIWYYPFTGTGYDRAAGLAALSMEASFVINSMKPALPITLNQAYACSDCTDDGLVFPTASQLLDWNCATRALPFAAVDWYPWRKFASYTEAIADVPSLWPFTTSGACTSGSGSDAVGLSAADGAPFVAPGSFVSLYGSNLAAAPQPATSEPLPPTLGGVTLQIVDSAGNRQTAPLSYVSPGLINFVLPQTTALGQAAVSIQTGTGSTLSGTALVRNVAPALFSADGSGTGIAAAVGLRVAPSGAQSIVPLYTCAGSGCTLLPIDLTPAGDFYVILYGTGIQNHTTPVTATLNSISVPVPYAGPSVVYQGVDQINLGPFSHFSVSGTLTLILSADGQTTNPLVIGFK